MIVDGIFFDFVFVVMVVLLLCYCCENVELFVLIFYDVEDWGCLVYFKCCLLGFIFDFNLGYV